MKKIVWILLFCSVALTAKCQFIDTLQSVIEGKGTFTFSFDSRNSFIGNSTANIFGFAAGVCFGNKLTIGGGYNVLSSPIHITQYTGADAIRTGLNFYYFFYFIEYTINFTKHWELDMPVLIGIGSSYYQYNLNNSAINERNRAIIPLEPQVQLDYNFNKYWGISTQVGYRLMLINNDILNYNFNSITYSAGVSISPFEIYAHFFPHTKLAKMIEANN